MKAFVEAIRKEPIASLLGILIILGIGYFVYVSRTMDRAPKEIVDVVTKSEGRLLVWAESLVNDSHISWEKGIDENGNPVASWYGKAGENNVPEWVKNLLGTGGVNVSAVRSKDAVKVFLLYTAGSSIGVTITLPSGKQKGFVNVSRLYRQ